MRGLLLFGALLLHQRDQLAGHEGKGHEDGGQHDAGHGEDDLHVMGGKPRAEPALQAEQQDVDQAGDHRRNGEGQVDQREQHALAREVELAIAHDAASPNTTLSGTAIAAVSSGQPDRRQRRRIAEARQIGEHAFAERLDEDRGQRQPQEQGRGTAARPRSRRGFHPGWLAPTCLRRLPMPAREPLQQVDAQQDREGRDQHDHRDRGGAGVVVLLQLGDDQQRRRSRSSSACCPR